MKKIFLILLIGMFMVSFASAGLIDGLPFYYNLDGTSGPVIDSTGFFDGINNGVTRGVPGIIRNAFQFDGSNNKYVNSTYETINADWAVSLWFNHTGGDAETLVSKFDGGSSSDGWSILLNSVAKNVQITLGGGGGAVTVFTSNDIYNPNEFVHIAVSYDESENEMGIYINGSFVENVSVNSNDQLTILLLGIRGQGLSNEFNGTIDEFGYWNRTLNLTEVQELYNSGNGFTYPFITQTISTTLDSLDDGSLVSSNVTFNATIEVSGLNLTNATIFIWDSSDDLFFTETKSITGNISNSTFYLVINLTIGDYTWNVLGSAVNSSGGLFTDFADSNRTFSWVPFTVDEENFNINVFETSRQEFFLNITTLPSILSLDAVLNYNGTRFTADDSCVSGLCQVSTAIDIPLVSSGQSENKSFFWEISVFDGTNSFFVNLTSDEQNATRLNLEKCDGTFTVETLNFTAFDEQTEAIINPFMFDGSFQFWLGTGTVKRDNSISESSIGSLQLCFTPATETLFLDGTIEYDEASGTNYTSRNYFFQNDEINNVSQDIELGLLLSEDSTSFILKVQDRDILPVANVLIFTERFYPGEGVFRVIQVSQTDDNGATIGFFKTETVEYRFILKQNGTTVLTTNKQKIVGESVPFTLTFTIGDDEGAAWEPFEEIDDLTSNVNFNKTSNIASFTYADTSGEFTLARLIVEKVNASGLTNIVICSETSTQSSAIITCNLTGNSTGQYIMRGIITRNSPSQLVEQESFAIEDFSTISGRLGLFLGFFIILISVFAFKFNEVAGIILVNLAIIFVNLIGLIAFGYGFISAIVAISIIILVVLER